MDPMSSGPTRWMDCTELPMPAPYQGRVEHENTKFKAIVFCVRAGFRRRHSELPRSPARQRARCAAKTDTRCQISSRRIAAPPTENLRDGSQARSRQPEVDSPKPLFADEGCRAPQPLGGIGAVVGVLRRFDAIEEVPVNDGTSGGGEGGEQERGAGGIGAWDGVAPLP